MKFTKYEQFGAYHWRQYDKNTKYRKHADRICAWVTEKNVLDVGAGDGKITSLLGIRGIDDEPEAVRLAQEKGVNVVLGDAYHLAFSDNEFEAVLMVDVLEHFDKPLEALIEARRVLTKALYIVTPPKGEKITDKFHVQEWTPEGLVALVESAGFKLDGEALVVPEEKCIYAKFKK